MRLRPSVRRRVRRQAAVSGGVIGGDKAKTVTAGTLPIKKTVIWWSLEEVVGVEKVFL